MADLSEKEVRGLAAQLRSPEGSSGIEVGQKMHETNFNMTMAGVKALDLTDEDTTLEIGHGNAGHIEQILSQADNLRYTGLDISQTMNEEAQRLNAAFVESEQASFHLYDGKQMPFKDHQFDKIMTVNTIYFWEQPIELLKEAYRVIKPGGLFSITFAEKSFMKELPFVRYGFQLYSTEDVKRLAEDTPFQLIDTDTEAEQVESKDGLKVERIFSIITLRG